MKYPHTSLLLGICLLWAGTVSAVAQQSHAAIREAALAFAQAQTRNIPGKVSIKIEDIDRRTTLSNCAALEAFLPNGAKLIGKTSIGVRCNQNPGWSVFVQTTIKVSSDLLVANKPLAQGLQLSADDFSVQTGELVQPGILTDPAQAIGKTLKFAIGAGQVLRLDMLRPKFVIRLGQTVRFQVRSQGFVIENEGIAMNDATEGQAVRVKVASGQLISAIANEEGSAEVKQ